jgi:hypothetical protein
MNLYHILINSADGKCTANILKMLDTSIGIIWSFGTERALLHHIDKSRFKLNVTISDIHWPGLDISTGWSRKVIDALCEQQQPLILIQRVWSILEIDQLSLERGIQKTLVKITLIKVSSTKILDLYGNLSVD